MVIKNGIMTIFELETAVVILRQIVDL